MKRKILSVAVAAGLGLGAANVANAAAITSLTLADVYDVSGVSGAFFSRGAGGVAGTDGSIGRFGFNAGVTSNFEGDTGTDMLWQGANQGAGVFTSGFGFGPAGTPFRPSTDLTGALDGYGNPISFPSGGAVGDITGGVLTVDNLDWGGVFGDIGGANITFYLAPDDPVQVNFVSDLGGGDFAVSFQWSHLITSAEDPTFTYVDFTANWIVEGIAHTDAGAPIPVPAAVWLMGSGLAGLAGVARRRKAKAV